MTQHRRAAITLFPGLAAMLLAACASAPALPDPQPGKGQIVVSLKATPKEGVRGPRKERVVDDYATSHESIESGRQYQRVKYDEIPDVVVLCSGGTGPAAAQLVAAKDGLDHSQLALSLAGGQGPVRVNVTNRRDKALTFVAVPRDAEVVGATTTGAARISDVAVAPGQTVVLNLASAAIYDLTCEEDENLTCVVYVTSAGAWIGTTKQKAFFDGLAPGEHDVIVYGPRLPVVRRTVRVAAGVREQTEAELTVNRLHKCGH
ncbi:MAG: hypothetical protein HS108_11945 [Planctomycetes bacterium]|nr:hypothetical protein [Planctomycetota bacterium]MCL4729975.1 hypothetical protein [Planctomycetota bacterium]